MSRSNPSVKFAAAVLELEIVGNTGKYAAALQPMGNPKKALRRFVASGYEKVVRL